MKRIALIVFIIICCFADIAKAAAWEQPRSTIQNHQLIFLQVRDEYQVRYGIGGLPSATESVRVNFWSTTNVYYDVIFNNPTGIAYLTCNGTYIFEMLDANGLTIAETTQIKTTKIVTPTCSSYQNGNFKNDLGITTSEQPNGSKIINFNGLPNGANKVEYYHNGDYRFDTDINTPGTTLTEPGLWTIVVRDAQGNIIGSSDVLIGNDEDNGGGDGGEGGGGSCDACKWLTDVLACPSWDEYMGELTNAIRDALPPPPDWNDVANTFVDHFADYFGNVPTLPTKQEIDDNIAQPLPTLDTVVPEASVLPQVPSDFNDGVLDTDITNGDVIEIVDESEPFIINEPDAFIDSDDVGVMVYPNDPRNSSNGIKEPDILDTGYTMPTPQPVAAEPMPTPQPVAAEPMPTPQPVEHEPLPTPQPVAAEPMPTPQPVE